jgi:ornithine carbamoyltransferase
MPMELGKEVSETLSDSTCSLIFKQSENRMHLQKSLFLNCYTAIGAFIDGCAW